MKKKVLSLLLAVIMVLSLIPVIAIPTSADDDALKFVSLTFTGYKGWCDADNGGQTRYLQRGNPLSMEEANYNLVTSGFIQSEVGKNTKTGEKSFMAISYDTSNYYPEIYLDSDGKFVRDKTFDKVDVDVDKDAYLEKSIDGHDSPYGIYYGYFTLELEVLSYVDTFTVYNQNNNWHLQEAFDLFYSVDGTTWTKITSCKNMNNANSWEGTETLDGKSCYYKTFYPDINAKYLAVAIITPSYHKQCALWYATATGALLETPPEPTVPTITQPAVNITSGSFTGYKGWLKANDGQDRYKQRAYTYGLRDTNPITSAFDGDASTWSSAYSVSAYYPEQYLNASGELVRDNTYDNVNEDVSFYDYAESGLGKYYGVFKFNLEASAELEMITIQAGLDGSNVDSNKAFDVLYSSDGVHWKVAASYTNMTAQAKWTVSDDVATLNVPVGNKKARYIAYAVSAASGQEPGGLWLYEIAAYGAIVPPSAPVSVVAGSFTGYKGFLKANDGQDRYKQRGYAITLSSSHPIAHAFDGSFTTYAGGTGGVGGYYPELYINDSGELVRDKTYDNVNENVVFSTYAASGLGKYYGVFKFTLETLTSLDTVTISAGPDGNVVDSVKAFDILYSSDGTHWAVAASYTDMTAPASWTTAENDVFTLDVPMNDVTASYIAFAPSIKSGQFNSSLWLFEISATGVPTKLDPVVYEVGTAEDLIAALIAHNASKNTEDVIKLTADVVLPSSYASDVGDRYIYGTFDGQGHTIYNLQKSFVWPYGDCLIENLTISGKTAPNGEEFSITGKDNAVFGGNAVATEIKAGETAIIRNVTNERDLIGTSNFNGGLFGAITIAGTVKFENCTTDNDCLQAPKDKLGESNSYFANNHKLGNYVGCMNSGTVIIENCVNNGDVNGSQAGGFIGKYSGACTIIMTNCVNNGEITGLNGSGAYGIAGGLIGSFNNAGSDDGSTIALTNCTNTGDILVANQGTKTNAIGGLIGHAGGGTDGVTTTITLDGCAVYGCTIDTDGANEYAAPLIGKCSPGAVETFTITATNCYVSNVNVIADTARKLIGVGSFSNLVVNAYNCLTNNLTVNGTNDWSGSKNSGVNVAVRFTAGDNGFADNDTENLISKGTAGWAQTATDRIRFVGTISEDTCNSGAYEKVGFFVTVMTDDGTVKGWNLSDKALYTALNTEGLNVWTPAEENGDKYAFALTIYGIPEDTNASFNVTPYLVAANGSMIFGSTGSYNLGSGL